jgi:hypothetical protein
VLQTWEQRWVCGCNLKINRFRRVRVHWHLSILYRGGVTTVALQILTNCPLSLSDCLSVSLLLALFLSACLSHFSLPCFPSVCLPACLPAWLPACLSVCLSVSLFLSLLALSVCLSVGLSVCLSVCLSLSLFLSVPLSVCLYFLSTCVPVCLFLCLSLALSLSFSRSISLYIYIHFLLFRPHPY